MANEEKIEIVSSVLNNIPVIRRLSKRVTWSFL